MVTISFVFENYFVDIKMIFLKDQKDVLPVQLDNHL